MPCIPEAMPTCVRACVREWVCVEFDSWLLPIGCQRARSLNDISAAFWCVQRKQTRRRRWDNVHLYSRHLHLAASRKDAHVLLWKSAAFILCTSTKSELWLKLKWSTNIPSYGSADHIWSLEDHRALSQIPSWRQSSRATEAWEHCPRLHEINLAMPWRESQPMSAQHILIFPAAPSSCWVNPINACTNLAFNLPTKEGKCCTNSLF